MPVRIGIIGDFNPRFASHQATNEALQHAGAHLGVPLESEWVPTPSLAEPGSETALERFNGILASPGSPYKSFNGMLRGIEFARHRNWPFVGT